MPRTNVDLSMSDTVTSKQLKCQIIGERTPSVGDIWNICSVNTECVHINAVFSAVNLCLRRIGIHSVD